MNNYFIFHEYNIDCYFFFLNHTSANTFIKENWRISYIIMRKNGKTNLSVCVRLEKKRYKNLIFSRSPSTWLPMFLNVCIWNKSCNSLILILFALTLFSDLIIFFLYKQLFIIKKKKNKFHIIKRNQSFHLEKRGTLKFKIWFIFY